MAFAHSPKIVTDEIGFYYDTGNGKSYKGEPTTNLHPNPEDVSSWTGDLFSNWTRSAVTSNVSIAPDGTLTADRIGDGYGRFNSSIAAIPGQTYVFTVYLKNVSLTNNFNITVGWGLNGSLVSYNSGATTVQISQLSNTEWTRVTTTEVAPSSGINQVQFGVAPFTGHGNPSGQTIDVWGGMIEQKSHATPYTTGTRSATESLFDFTKTHSIDLSNVSFDSDAQMTFDGSNDYIELTGNVLNVNSFTIEAIVNITSTGNYNKPIFVAGDISSTGIWFLKHRSGLGNRLVMHGYDGVNPRVDVTSTNVVPDAENAYVAVTFNGTSYQLYINGVADGNSVLDNKVGATTTNFIGKQGGTYLDGDIPMMKVYNRGLNASEIKQNYNAIKSRFEL